ncbi:pyridoxal-phosphate dependent enzyme [bacterium]|nr:pyridoxal-phosphate dependent enzyme [bacterium]
MVSLKDIRAARNNIVKKIYRTPVLTKEFVNKQYGTNIILKLENLQVSGAFKIRGVLNKIASLTTKERENGIICATSGNHGLGIAYVSYWNKLKSAIVVPETTPEYKINKLKQLTKVIVTGASFLESCSYAVENSISEHQTFIHPFADPLIIAGQGTIGLELVEQVPNMDCVVVPIGGGGLLSGILISIKEMMPSVKIVGVQAEGAASMFVSWKEGVIRQLEKLNTIAEGIAVKKTEELNFSIIKKYVDNIVLVNDNDIKFAMKTLFDEYKMVGETAGVVSLAAILKDKIGLKCKNVVSLISGGNIALNQFATQLT